MRSKVILGKLNAFLRECTDVAGRFRAFHIKWVLLFEYAIKVCAHYLAVLQAVPMVRKHMEKSEDLYAEHESNRSSDTLYR